ncbi:MAG TPA: 2-hydroxyacyl-CoA dehydratase family protein [Spirochaetota bacterium]|mgnify:FL=1|nr:2-hydroxyacyl-CoA dehydratase family protein [Spirochaetota bacterium]HPV42100.1 2-hydroxyacyl-CoA dehydratase family protein [Spirochaetota bacterium]
MKKIAYFDSSHDMPEEIIMAAGFVPYKIFGDVHASNAPADQYLQAFFCPAARSFLTEALTRSSEWEGIIVAQGCNATNRHYDVWKRHVSTPFLHWFNGPIKDDSMALRFMKTELWRLIDTLNRQYKVSITDDMIAAASRESNEVKKKLQKLSALRSEKDITNREYLTVLIKSMTLPKKDAVAAIDELIGRAEKGGPIPKNKIKVLLTGSDVTYPELMDQIDESGFRVVRDDLSVGERYYATLIPEDGNPVDALARYYLSIPKPATKVGLRSRIEYLERALSDSGLDTVISQNIKFCEPFAYDSVLVNGELKDKGIRILHLEREFTPGPDHQLMNRLAAFSEML